MDEQVFQTALANPQNLGEMADADAVGTVGSPDCGDMLRMWLKFKEQDGRKIIDRATFQSFGCQTALAVASMATEMLKGRTIEEAKQLSAAEMSSPLGALPPMKIHCGQMVEGALRAALESEAAEKNLLLSPMPAPLNRAGSGRAPMLGDALKQAGKSSSNLKISFKPNPA